MKCYSEGDLRSYLDGELPPEAMECIAAHLFACDPCAAAIETLSARVRRVSALLATLAEPVELVLLGGAGASACPPAAVRQSPRRRWLPAAAALAASLALAFLLLPKHAKPPQPAVRVPMAAIAPPVPQVEQAVRPARPHQRVHPRKPTTEYFLALDNDPFEVGVVRRVALGPDEIPADVVFGPDGRARAIRMVDEPEH